MHNEEYHLGVKGNERAVRRLYNEAIESANKWGECVLFTTRQARRESEYDRGKNER